MSPLQATTTRLPLVRHNQTTGANKYGNNQLRPQDLSTQYISFNLPNNFLLGDYGSRANGYTYVSFPEVINVQAVELYAAATAEMTWSKEPFTSNDKVGSSPIPLPSGSIHYSGDGLAVTNGSKIWSPLVTFSAIDNDRIPNALAGGEGAGFDVDKNKPTGGENYTVGVGSVDDAYFGYKNVTFPLTYGRINLPVKDGNLKNLMLRFSGSSERVRATFYTAPEDGGREFLGEASSVCLLTAEDYYVYVIQDGPSAYDKAPLIPNITTQPTSSGYISLATGETSTITDDPVGVSSNGTISYQWYKEDTAISGATTNDYGITSAQTTDAGTYYCQVINTVSSNSTKLNTTPIVVTVGTGLVRPTLFANSTNAFWVDKSKLADSDPATYATIGTPSIPLSYTVVGGGNYTASYDQDYNVFASFRYRPLGSGKLTVKYQKIGTTNSPNTVASALAQYSINYTDVSPSWTTFATALGTDGTTDVLVYELTSLPSSAEDLAVRFGKNNLKGYNSSVTPVSANISTYATGNGSAWTNPADALNSSGSSVSDVASAATITYEEIYSCSTVATAGSATISGTATYDLASAVDSAEGILGSINSVVGNVSLKIQYSIDSGSTWVDGFTRATVSRSSLLETPSPDTKTGSNVSFSFSPTQTDLDLTKIKIKLLLEIEYNSLTSDDGFGNEEFIEAGGTGTATIKNLSLNFVPPTIELSTSEFRVNEIYLEYDVDQPLTDTVSLSSNKTTVSSGGPVILTPRFNAGSGSINNGVGSVVSATTYTVNPTTTTIYTLTVGSITKTKTITVVAAPVATSLTAGSSQVSNGNSTTLTPIFSSGTGVITPGSTSVTSGTPITVTPTSTTTYILTVTNALSETATTTAQIEVVATPSSSLARGAAVVTNGSTTTITPTFSNGTAVIGTSGQDSLDIINPAISGSAVTVTPASSATTTYTLTVTATATGQKTTATTTVQAVAAPTITSFTVNGAASANITVGNTVTLLGNFTGSGIVNNSVGSITTNTNKVITISSTGAATYTLTASNTATTPGTTTTSVTITGYAAPVATSLTAGAASITNGGSTTLTPTFSNGTGKIGTTSGGSQVTASATSGTPVTVSPTSTTTYYLTVTNTAGTTASTNTTVTVVAAPVATSLTPAASTLTAGSSTTLTPVFSGGTCKIGTTAGGSQVTSSATSGEALTVSPSATQTYYMTVTNSLSATATTTAAITVVAAPLITSLTRGAASITNGTSTTLVPVFSNGTGSINNEVGSVTSGSTYTVSPSSTTTYTLTVTNAANSTATSSTTVTVVPAPVATSLTPGTSTITAGTSTTLTPVFSNGTGSINTVGAVTSGLPRDVYPESTITYTLTVTNAIGATASTNTTVTVVPAPVATSLTAGSTNILRGNSTTLTPVFSNGTGVITPGSISATSGTPITVSPTSSTSYALTVTNSVGTTDSIYQYIGVYIRPNSFTSPAILSGVTDGLLGDETTYTQYYVESDGLSTGYIGFASLSTSGYVTIKYKKVGSFDSRAGGTPEAYLKYATDGASYNTQLAAVSASDGTSSMQTSTFYFDGNLANLKFSVDFGYASTMVQDCLTYGDYDPETDSRACIDYDDPYLTASTAGFFIYDVAIVV